MSYQAADDALARAQEIVEDAIQNLLPSGEYAAAENVISELGFIRLRLEQRR